MKKNNILALKYRPQIFEDLIGQDVIAKTISNAIKLGKTPNAYLLNGIRGVGKTTTARLIAKALNCINSNSDKKECSKTKQCSSCSEIADSSHIDVLEMDAASKTGIDDIREIIENSKYSPTSAKFKIFIIDEVHMLSKQAFNGLLKTLEEPPPSLKFILATTEVRKIPVTILSRCQRFDLKRVSIENLTDHLKFVAETEKIKISENALRLIASVSEGSVRDSLSLMDRALVAQKIDESKKLEEKDVREMLGLMDKRKIILLLKEVFEGNQKNAVDYLQKIFNEGLDAKNFLNDVLYILNLFSRKLTLGSLDKDLSISESELSSINKISNNLKISDINLFWHLTIKSINDLKVINNEYLLLEMYIIQLCHLEGMREFSPSEQQSDNLVVENKGNKLKTQTNKDKDMSSKTIKDQLKSTQQIKTSIEKKPSIEKPYDKLEINSIDSLIEIVEKEKEVELKYDLERNVNLVSFSHGKIDINFNENLSKNFVKNLSEKLYDWTGKRWIISFSQKIGKKSVFDIKKDKIKEDLTTFENNEITSKLKSIFPDAKITNVIDGEQDE